MNRREQDLTENTVNHRHHLFPERGSRPHLSPEKRRSLIYHRRIVIYATGYQLLSFFVGDDYAHDTSPPVVIVCRKRRDELVSSVTVELSYTSEKRGRRRKINTNEKRMRNHRKKLHHREKDKYRRKKNKESPERATPPGNKPPATHDTNFSLCDG